MLRGYCGMCGRSVGGVLRPAAWFCPRCKRIYCEKCSPRSVGVIFKKRVCPSCRIEMVD